jgi:MFS family permease
MGFASGFYVVPLNAWLQDLAEEDRRARIISALNLMTSFSGVVAVMVGFTLDKISIDPSGQIIVMVPFLIVVAVILSRFLTTDAPNSK